ncbi:hypothetical protein ACSNOB_00150 [Micromonospora sp. URMC 106]|uniref:hypothetical protein n=1 Tax=Micromonospora sp. URMC 106 TaxID=3423408 RepID=UPI003F1AFFBB
MARAGDPCFDAADYVLEGLDRAEVLRRRDELAAAAGARTAGPRAGRSRLPAGPATPC